MCSTASPLFGNLLDIATVQFKNDVPPLTAVLTWSDRPTVRRAVIPVLPKQRVRAAGSDPHPSGLVCGIRYCGP